MKVVLLAPGLNRVVRGYERFTLDLAAELRKAGLDASCWGTSGAPGVEELPVLSRGEFLQSALERLRADARFAKFPAPLLQDWAVYSEDQLFSIPAAVRIQQLLNAGEQVLVYAKWQGGLVDASGAPTVLLKSLATASRAEKARLLVHTDYVYHPILATAWNAGAVFHAIGPWVADPLTHMGVPKHGILELPMCIRASAYRHSRQQRSEARRAFGIPDDAFVLLSVGAFDITTPDKRYPYLLKEILSLPNAERIWWVVAGSRGPVTAAWEQEAHERLGARFVPLANMPFEEMPRVYGMADLFVLASLDETFGLVFVEAQAAGLPLVIHDCPISRYLCRDLPPERLNISIADMRRAGTASEAMRRWIALLTNPQQKEALRSSLDRFAQLQDRRFGWETLGPRYTEAFVQLLRPRTSPAAQKKDSRDSRETNQTREARQALNPGTWDEQNYREGARLFKEGKPAQALVLLGKALAGREDSERWNDWAAVQTSLKNLPEAEQGFRRALALDRRHTQAAANLGGLLAGMGRPGEAIPLLEQCLPAIDAQQKPLVLQLLQECRAKLKAARSVEAPELERFLRRFVPPESDAEYHFHNEFPYWQAVLNSMPPGSAGQCLLGVGPDFGYLAPAFVWLKGYSEVLWLAMDSCAPAEGRQEVVSMAGPEGQPLTLSVDHLHPGCVRWPYESDRVDTFFFGRTLETLHADPMRILLEVNRILKPDGQLLLTVPNIASAKGVQAILRGRNPSVDSRFRAGEGDASDFHTREYTSEEIGHLVQAAGFGVLQSYTQDIFWEPPAKVFSALAASGCPLGSRGDTIVLVARKESAVRDRAPAKLYNARKPARSETGENLERAKNSAADTGHGPLRILVVHENLPRADQSGAEYRLLQVLRELRRQGHAVTYLAPRGFEKEKYAGALAALGIDIYVDDAQVLRVEGFEISPDWTLQEVLHNGQFDVALFFLWFWMSLSIPEHYLDDIRCFSPRTRIAILTDDCHGLRELRGAELSRAWSDRERATDYHEREIEIFRCSDLVLSISEDDRQKLAADAPQAEIGLLPMVVEAGPAGPGFDSREGVMYLADYNNPASRDGVDWYLREVAPLVRQALPDLKTYLVGAALPADLAADDPNVVRVGFAPDLATELAKHRILISPVRYGTGTKTKNLHALAHGVPVITTTIGAEGIDLQSGRTALIADDAESFAREVIRLYADRELWKALAEAGRSHILSKFPHERMAALLREMLERARSMRPKRYDPSHTWSMRLIERMFPEVLTYHPPENRTALRVLAYARAAQDLLAAGNREEARRQLRHVFSYVPSRVPRDVFFTGLRAVVDSMERSYRALGEAQGAEAFRREAATFAPDASAAGSPVSQEKRAPGLSSPDENGELDDNKDKQIEFSVIIPTYNRRETLAECLDALRRQSFSAKRFEVIVIDDGSSDGTEDLCRDFRARYGLQYIRQANAGAGAARRAGVQRARGKYLLLFNDDTIPSPALLTKHRQALREHAHEKVAILGDFRYPRAARNRALTYFLSTEPFLFPQATLEAGEHAKSAYFIASNLSIRRDAVVAAGSFDPQFRVAEDTELGVRLRRDGFRVLYVPEARAIHQHVSFTFKDLVRRAEVYGRTQLLLFRKHPGLLGDGTGIFGRLDDDARAKMRSFIEQHRHEVEAAQAGLEKFDELDFAPFLEKPSGQRTAADEVMDSFKRAVPTVYWFHLFESFLAAWNAEANPCSPFASEEVGAHV